MMPLRPGNFNDIVALRKFPDLYRDDYSLISMRRVLILASANIGMSVNVQHCRQMKYNPNIGKAEKAGYIIRKREGGRVHKRTVFYITPKGTAALMKPELK